MTIPQHPAVRIEELRTRAAPLEMTSDQFRSLGRDLVDRIADFLKAQKAEESNTQPATAEAPKVKRTKKASSK